MCLKEIPSWSQQSVFCVILGDSFLEIPHQVVSSAQLQPPHRGHLQTTAQLRQKETKRTSSRTNHHGPPPDQYIKPNGLQSGVQRREAASVDRGAARQRFGFAERRGVPGGGGRDPPAPGGMRAAAAQTTFRCNRRAARMENTDDRGRRHVSWLGNNVIQLCKWEICKGFRSFVCSFVRPKAPVLEVI